MLDRVAVECNYEIYFVVSHTRPVSQSAIDVRLSKHKLDVRLV